VIDTAKAARNVTEVIVVADGSQDDTADVAIELGVKVVKHKTNLGKGAAMETGAENAINERLVYLDADVSSFTTEDINKITDKLEEGYDFVKTYFYRDSGRVTQLTVRPLLKRFFPEVFEKFPEPLSGQVGITKSTLNSIEVVKDYGVEIAMLLDLYIANANIASVEINWLKHRHHDVARLPKMAVPVSRALLARRRPAMMPAGRKKIEVEQESLKILQSTA
jgi:glycosyltransferase involved in cell wall biosynthesis